MPDLVGVVSPDTEAEFTAIVEMLEAHDVPCFVCDARPGCVSSGVHSYMRTPRTIMVPRTRMAEAAALMGDLKACMQHTAMLLVTGYRAGCVRS